MLWHTSINVCKSNACKFTDIWHEKPNNKRWRHDNTSRMWPLFVLAARRISNCWRRLQCCVTRGAIYWHFKNKSDYSVRSGSYQNPILVSLRLSIRQNSDDPLSVLREILVHILEATVTEERRRLLMEIIFHKCEFVGEMVVVQQAQRSLCLESYDRIEQTLKHCINAKCCLKIC